MKTRYLVTFLLLAFVMAFSANALADTGAIWTTDNSCVQTNDNHYPAKTDVYLQGGPKGGGGGLPDGQYFVKITTPSGDLLGSSPSANVNVTDGKISQCYQLWSLLLKASDHSQGYDNTTNNGGEYKVWVSMTSDFASQKTDNFKALIEGVPSVHLVKTASPLTYSVEGGESVINYSLTVTNTGTAPLTNVEVTDSIASVSCPKNTLASTEVMVCTATYTLQPGDFSFDSANQATGKVINIAHVTTFQGVEDSSTQTVLQTGEQQVITGTASMDLQKAASPVTYDHVGQQITYTYTVTNTGTLDLTNLSISDDHSAGFSAPMTCDSTSIAAGLVAVCTAYHDITQADLDAGSIVNIANASALDKDGNSVPAGPAQATVTAVQSPALSLDKTGASPLANDGGHYDAAGQTISYNYAVTNSGNVTLSAPFSVSDDLISSVDCSSAPATLAPGASFNCSASYSVQQSDLDSNRAIVNTAVAHGNFKTTVVDSNQDSVTEQAIQRPSLSLLKSADVATYGLIGDVVTYTYNVSNTGNVTLTGFSVSDDKLGSFACSSAAIAPGGSTSCTAAHTITLSDINNGSITNIAHASTDFNGNHDSNDSSVTVNANRGTVSVAKYYDGDRNGALALSGEALIAGWKINYSGKTGGAFGVAVSGSLTTDGTGNASVILPAGSYTVIESQSVSGNWSQTGNTVNQSVVSGGASANLSSKVYSLVIPSNQNSSASGVVFGNVCQSSPGVGHTLGFWSNKNGQALTTNADLAVLVGMNLVNQNGSAFDPTAKTFSNWLTSASSGVNSAYMLSAQMAAAYLDTVHGFDNGGSVIVDSAPAILGGQPVNRTLSQEIAYANALLGAYPGPAMSASVRAEQDRVKTILDISNNGGSFFQPNASTCSAFRF